MKQPLYNFNNYCELINILTRNGAWWDFDYWRYFVKIQTIKIPKVEQTSYILMLWLYNTVLYWFILLNNTYILL